MINGCAECLRRQQQIDRLTEEVTRLKAKLRREERKANEGFFASSTPSAKRPLKQTSLAENQLRRGGAKKGHKGHGRKTIHETEADHIRDIEAPVGDHCPHCHTPLVALSPNARGVIDSVPVKADKVLYRLGRKLCPKCRVTFKARTPSVMPKALYGNQLVTNLLVMHYAHGIPLGRLEEILGIPYSAMVQIQHRLARLFADVHPRLVAQYRQAPVKHADETGWRTDGANGYAWLFATDRLSIFEFRTTRSGSVAAAILGTKRLPGTLVVDRYKGYNRAPCAQQYCYAHLLRNLTDLEKEFPDSQEVRAFVDAVAPLLGMAMGLRLQAISNAEFYKKAKKLKRQLRAAMNADAQHLGIRAYQEIFRDNKQRMYHWAKDRSIPAENNLAERDLRPTVIARKVSFGSQSEAGAKTRSILMSVLMSLKKQAPQDYSERIKAALDHLATHPKAKPYRLLFPP